MRKLIFLSVLLLSLIACQRSFTVVAITDSQQKFTEDYTAIDSTMESEIAPYRDELQQSMGGLIVEASVDLPKAKPESLLGNLLADATLEMAIQYSTKPVDVGIINYGGIRVPSISKGPVSLGNVYEVMPFDNYLVVLELKGEQLRDVFNLIAQGGGWPISGAQFVIKDEKAASIKVGEANLDLNKTYRVAISDYLANGGDHLDLLKGLPQENTNVLLRDAFIAYFQQIHAQGKKLEAQIENRITNE